MGFVCSLSFFVFNLYVVLETKKLETEILKPQEVGSIFLMTFDLSSYFVRTDSRIGFAESDNHGGNEKFLFLFWVFLLGFRRSMKEHEEIVHLLEIVCCREKVK